MIEGLLVAFLSLPAADGRAGEIARIVEEAEALGVRTGVCIRTHGAKRYLYAHREREGFIPASNMKLFTAALVLETLGEGHQFETRFLLHEAAGQRSLRIVSGGDPLLQAEREGQPLFADLARALAKRATELAGFWLDAAGWSGPGRPAGWPRDQLHLPYAASTGPFVLDEGCFRVELTPHRAHTRSCPVQIEPDGFRFSVKGRVTLTDSRQQGRRPSVWLAGGSVRLGGKIWRGSQPAAYSFAAPAPVEVFVQVLRHQLASGGVKLGPRLAQPPPGEGELVHAIRSPLSDSLRRLLEDSSNLHAEQLLRVVGGKKRGEASLRAGRELLEERFGHAPLASGEWVVADGSGLSRGNRTSPRLVCQVLDHVLGSDLRRSFVDALPQSGVSGSLASRMGTLRGRVRAKTGWIRGASSLSGTVLGADGKVHVFSILMNYAPGRSGLNRRLKRLQDRIVAVLAAGP